MSSTDWGQWMADTKADDQQKDPQNIDNNCDSLTSIDDLGEYELIKIFSYFTVKERLSFSTVCSQWKDCVQKSLKSQPIFNSSEIDPRDGGISHKLFIFILQKCPNVRHISLTGIGLTFEEEDKELTDLMESIVSNCSQLQSLDFGNTPLTEKITEKFTDYLLRLKKISSVNMKEDALNCIIGSEQLQTLNIFRNLNISKPQFERLGPKIRELNLIQSSVVDIEPIKNLCEGNGKRIEVLSIEICDKTVLSEICDNLTKLKELNICLNSENCNFMKFANFIDLKTLEIKVEDKIFREEEFIDLIRALKSTKISELKVILSPLNNIAITDGSLQELRTNCPLIEKLVIRGSNSLTGSGMFSIAQLTNLRHLDLKKCSNISDQINIVISSCPLLRELIVHSCSYISKETVESFVEKAKTSPKELFLLDVIDTNVSHESLPIEDKPKNLKILFDIEDCDHIDCEHGWGADGYHSGESEIGFNEMVDDLEDFYGEDDHDFYDDYGDEDYDYEFS